jgi:hypothetical protein
MDQTVAAVRAVSEVLHGALQRLTPDPATLAALVLLWAAVGAFVGYELVRTVQAGRR